jgi:hypothetical protein
MYRYIQKGISKKTCKNKYFLLVLKVTDEKSRIRIRKSVVRIRGSGSVPKGHGSTALDDSQPINSRTVYGSLKNRLR